jgi:serine protease Do
LLLGTGGALFGVAGAGEEPRRREAAVGNLSVDLAIKRVYPALVRIYVVAEEPSAGRMERVRGAGSGVIVSSAGYVVTNHHVAGNAVRLHCTLADGEQVEALRVGTDPLSDVAVLKLKLDTRKRPDAAVAVAAWGDSSLLKVGDVVLAMGSPMAISQSVTQGIVSNTQMIMPKFLDRSLRLDGEDVGQLVRWIGHDAVVFLGNSGGPLVNLRGEIVGINEIDLGSLGGAIPSNLVRDVVDQLITRGRVTRSWLGLEFQPRFKGHNANVGALVAGVVEGSPAAKAGIVAGDVVTRFRGQSVNAELPEHVPLINQWVFATPVGQTVELAYLRNGREHVARVTTEDLKRALGKPRELKPWGITVRDITRMMALERHRQGTRGVLVDSVSEGGGAGTAKLPLQPEDVILQVAGKNVADVAALQRVTAELLEGKTDRVPVLVQFERETERLATVVKVGPEESQSRPAAANKPWSSLATQVLTSDLAESLGLAGQHGVRVTHVFTGRAADKAGVKVGDVILAVNGRRIEASQLGDHEVFDTLIRKLRVGRKAVLRIVRDGKPLELAMLLEAPPSIAENVKRLNDADFEIGARELSYMDRVSRHIPEGLQGVLLQKVETGGWASLGGLHADDIVVNVDGKPTPAIADFKRALDQIRKDKPRRVLFFVRRGIHTLFCEIEPDYR